MGHHVFVVDDARRRRVLAALFHPRDGAARNAPSDLILAEVSEPRQHGMDQELVERKP